MGAASYEQEGLLWIFRWITQWQCEDWWSHWLNTLVNLTWHFLVDLVVSSVSIFFSLFPVVPTFFFLSFFLFLFFLVLLYVTLMIWYLFPWYYFYCAHLCMKCSLGISNFLKEISNLSHSNIFLYFFAMITEESFLISPFYSLQLCIQMDISFLFSFTFGFSLFLRYLQGLLRQPFCLFPFLLRLVLITASCTMSQTSFYSSSGTL